MAMMLCTACGLSRNEMSFWSVDLRRYVARCALCRTGESLNAYEASPKRDVAPPAPPAVEDKVHPRCGWDKNVVLIQDANVAQSLEYVFAANPTLGMKTFIYQW